MESKYEYHNGVWTEKTIMSKKDKLIVRYQKLYSKLWNNNANVLNLNDLSEKELRVEIKEMEQAIKEQNSYYPGLAH